MAVAALVSAVRRPQRGLATGCSDEQLVQRVREGDEAAFEAIYDRYAPGMLAFCRHLLGGPDEAEDALQQSFARAYDALRADVVPLCLKAWLYAIARNGCMTILAGRRDVIDLDAVRHAVRPAEDCYAEVQRRADVGDLVDDLRRLPDDQRAALVLFELGGHSQDDIAEILGAQRARVKALVFQAREGLARARDARAVACRDVLEELVMLRGPAPRRGPLADHLARCEACAGFAAEVGRQRRALALVLLPAVPSGALKAKVLGSVLTGGGGAAAGGVAIGGTGGGGALVAAAGGGSAGGGGALAVAGAGAGGAGTLGAAGAAGTAGLAGVGSLATMGAGSAAVGLAAQGVVAKILVAVAIVGSAAAVTTPLAVHQPAPVTPASTAPLVAAHPGAQSATPAEPADQPLPSPAPAPADLMPPPVAQPLPAVSPGPPQATTATAQPVSPSAPEPAAAPAPQPAAPAPQPAAVAPPQPEPAASQPDAGGTQAAPAASAPTSTSGGTSATTTTTTTTSDPAPTVTGGESAAPVAETTPPDTGGTAPVDSATGDATTADGTKAVGGAG